MKLILILSAFALLCAQPCHALIIGHGRSTNSSATVSDDFSADTFANYTTITSESTLSIASGQVRGSTVARNGWYYSAGTFSANQYAALKIATLHDNNIGPMVRVSPSTESGYVAVTTATVAKIRKLVSGTFSDVGATFTIVFTAGDILKLSANGSTLELFHNVVSLGTRTDSSLSTGNPGIFIYSTTARGDDFSAGGL